jgi:5-methylcytosine-specific restriction protein A
MVHIDDHKDLHLFQQVGPRRVKYIGQMVYVGHEELEVDFKGTRRKAIVFHLAPIEDIIEPLAGEKPIQPKMLSEEELLRRAKESSKDAVKVKEAIIKIRERSEWVRAYALNRAQGKCEYCHNSAPFLDGKGKPFLEVHHILSLSDGGPDDYRYVITLCPNCHRRAHYGNDSKGTNEAMLNLISELE